MPARHASLAITDAYRVRLLLLRNFAAAQVTAAWGSLDIDRLDATFARWLRLALATMTMAQREAAGLSGAYLASYVDSELGRRSPGVPVDPDRYAGRTSDGRPLSKLLIGGLIAAKVAMTNRVGPTQALAMGRARVVRAAHTEVLEASRLALTDAMSEDERVIGWRRVTSDNPCGACLGAADGRIYHDAELPHVHGHCRCTSEPVVRGVKERVQRPTGRQLFDAMSPAQQDHLFAGRGGAAKADLIRSGAVSLERLVTTEPQEMGRSLITETPLDELVG